jgi:hypothetical protein
MRNTGWCMRCNLGHVTVAVVQKGLITTTYRCLLGGDIHEPAGA